MTAFAITREIGIDMGHRVTNHASKCRNLHGHRYRIEATVRGELVDNGSEEGMVMDFGFLKEEMMEAIDKRFDHGLALWIDDPLTNQWVRELRVVEYGFENGDKGDFLSLQSVYDTAKEYGALVCLVDEIGKVAFTADVPTAENLAKLWYEDLECRVNERTQHRAKLIYIRVWETPNCMAQYPVSPLVGVVVETQFPGGYGKDDDVDTP